MIAIYSDKIDFCFYSHINIDQRTETEAQPYLLDTQEQTSLVLVEAQPYLLDVQEQISLVLVEAQPYLLAQDQTFLFLVEAQPYLLDAQEQTLLVKQACLNFSLP